MFNLLLGVTKGVADASRMLEFTNEDVRHYVAPAGRVAASRLLNLPTLVMPEIGDSGERQVAQIGRLTQLQLTGKRYRYEFTPLHEIPSEDIETYADALRIDDFEFVRTHWAVKDADLYAVLDGKLQGVSTPAENYSTVDLMVRLPQKQLDALLTVVGGSPTTSGWDQTVWGLRRVQAETIIGDLSPLQQVAFESALKEELTDQELASAVDLEAMRQALYVAEGPAVAGVFGASQLDSPQPTVNPNGPIFVVHGHNHATLHLAVRILERGTGREVVVLHEQANSGRTVLEKFEHHAASAAFAVVLLTADDEGAPVGSSAYRKRARQNVILELGFFFGQLGRQRVVVLVDEGVEQPSDIAGLVYISLDAAGAWKYALGRELEAASIPVDYRRMP